MWKRQILHQENGQKLSTDNSQKFGKKINIRRTSLASMKVRSFKGWSCSGIRGGLRRQENWWPWLVRWVISKSVFFQCTGYWLGPRMMWEQVSKFLVYHCRLCSCEDLEARCAAENHWGQHSCCKMALPEPLKQLLQDLLALHLGTFSSQASPPSLYPTASAKQCLWWLHASFPHRSAGLPHVQQLPTSTASQFCCSTFIVPNGSFPSKELFSLGTKHPEPVDSNWHEYSLQASFAHPMPSTTLAPFSHNLCCLKGKGPWEWGSLEARVML